MSVNYDPKKILEAITKEDTQVTEIDLRAIAEPLNKAHVEALIEEAVMEHFHKRGLTDATIKEFGLGYCEGGVREILKDLPELQFGGDFGKDHKFLFPCWNEHDEPENFVAEYFDREHIPDNTSKYIKIKGIPAPLYNGQRLRAEKLPEFVFVVEGIYDCLALEQCETPAVALVGTAPKPLIEECVKHKPKTNFILMLDNDDPGQKATPKAKNELEKLGYFVYTPKETHRFKDTGEFLQNDEAGLKAYLEQCVLDAQTALYYWREEQKAKNTDKADILLNLATLNNFTKIRIIEAFNGIFSKYPAKGFTIGKSGKKATIEPKDILKNILACLYWLGVDEAAIHNYFELSTLHYKISPSDVEEAFLNAREVVGSRRQNFDELKRYGYDTENVLRLFNFDKTYPGNAERVLYLYPEKILYILENERFYLWSGNYWQEGQKKCEEMLPLCLKTLRFAESIVDKVFPPDDLCISPEELKSKTIWHDFFNSSQNSKKKLIDEGMKSMGELQHHANELDVNPWLFNAKNFTIDLRTGATYKAKQTDYITKSSNADFLPDVKSDLWERTLKAILPDAETRKYLQKFCGYGLTGSVREHKALFAYGEGGCGKSTIFNAIAHVMGNYAKTIPIDVLMSSRNDGDGERATPFLASLQGVRLVIANESKIGQRLNDAQFKNTTGGDVISARKLYAEGFNFEPSHKLIMLSNYPPSLQDGADEGVKQRLVILPFKKRFRNTAQDDKTLSEQLREPENMASILKWQYEGLEMWTAEGLGNPPPEIKQATDEYFAEADELGNFLQEFCHEAQFGRVRVGDLHKRFNYETDRKMRLKDFCLAMERRGYKKIRENSRSWFLGLVME